MYKWIKNDDSELRAISLYGELTYEILQDLLAELEELERLCPAGFNRFADLRKVEEFAVDSAEIKKIANRRLAGYRGPSVRSAILATDPLNYGMARVYAAMMEPSPIDVSVFYTLEECAEWLKVTPEDIWIDD